ncbi:MAG: protein containing YHS domain protein [Candidatus Colwellbacteria bacterium]
MKNPKYKICVSGAADISHLGEEVIPIAEELGREVARHNAVLVDGATTGFPYWAAKGAKGEGGMVVGFSPAKSEEEHAGRYELPLDYHDLIVYTGFDYSGRNLILTRAADAVVIGPGRMGTLNEFTIAFEDGKPIGILEGDWETDEIIKLLIEKSHRAEEREGKIIFARDPKNLIDQLVKVIERSKNEK